MRPRITAASCFCALVVVFPCAGEAQSTGYVPGPACVVLGTCNDDPQQDQAATSSAMSCQNEVAERDSALFDEFDKARRQYAAAVDAQATMGAALKDLRSAKLTAGYAELGLQIAHTAKLAADIILALSGEGATVRPAKIISGLGDLGTATSTEEDKFAAMMLTLGPIGDAISVFNDAAMAAHDLKDAAETRSSLEIQIVKAKKQIAIYVSSTKTIATKLRDSNARREFVDRQCSHTK